MRRTLLTLTILTLVGCGRKDLYYGVISQPGAITISADWNNTQNIPGGIVVYLYPEDGPVKADYSKSMVQYIPNLGSTISLPYGTYYGLIYNDYTEDLLFRNMEECVSAEAYLKRNHEAPFSTRSPTTKSVGCAESFYNAQIGTFTLSKESPSLSIAIVPKLKTLKIDLTISLKGGKNIAYARGTLSGVNKAINLSTGKSDRNNIANVVFDFQVRNNTIESSIRCFGINNLNTTTNRDVGTPVNNKLEIAFILKDGSQIIGDHIFDITDIIKKITPTENEGVCEDILLTLDDLGIVIPDVKGSGEGFDINVGDWDEPIIEELT